MKIDHIFIFSDKGKEADELVNAGFSEGSGRHHSGLGTRNRRFFFEDFYLEILWVENEEEAKSHPSLGLWERSNFRMNDFSRFGLCLVNDEKTDQLFENAPTFQPDYYPEGKQIELFSNMDKPFLPWIFRLPNRSGKKSNLDEPTSYDNLGISQLTKAIFETKTTKIDDKIVDAIEHRSTIEFILGQTDGLILEFDNVQQQKTIRFEQLGIAIHY